MIPIEFEYYQPTSVMEAVQIYQELRADQKTAVFYGGGTEIISRARMNEITPNAVIDLKKIPECNAIEKDADQIVIGSTVSLTGLTDNSIFPLLSNVARSIAFRTARNKITIGGNISGNTFYREALLPFLLSDSIVVLAGEDGTREVPIEEITQNGTTIKNGEFIVQIHTNNQFSQYPYTNHKTTKQSKVNYPIVSFASIKVDDQIRIAFSGVCPFPFRLKEMEEILNDSANSPGKRIQMAIDMLPGPILNDVQASGKYREFVLRQSLSKLLDNVEGAFS